MQRLHRKRDLLADPLTSEILHLIPGEKYAVIGVWCNRVGWCGRNIATVALVQPVMLISVEFEEIDEAKIEVANATTISSVLWVLRKCFMRNPPCKLQIVGCDFGVHPPSVRLDTQGAYLASWMRGKRAQATRRQNRWDYRRLSCNESTIWHAACGNLRVWQTEGRQRPFTFPTPLRH